MSSSTTSTSISSSSNSNSNALSVSSSSSSSSSHNCPVRVSIRIRPETLPKGSHNVAADSPNIDLLDDQNIDPVKLQNQCVFPLPDGCSIMLAPQSNSSSSVSSSINHSSTDDADDVSTSDIHPASTKTFKFDAVFTSQSSQSSVYESTVSTLIDDVIDGYSATVFAYGHTGSGKTYTMFGPSSLSTSSSYDEETAGIIPRAVSQIFNTIKALTAESKDSTSSHSQGDVIFLVRMSYVELYNNTFRNLLEDAPSLPSNSRSYSNSNSSSSQPPSPSISIKGNARKNTGQKIEVREHPSSGVFLSGPPSLHHTVTTPQRANSLILYGMNRRATGATGCNDTSSRSHSILTIHVESQLRLSTSNSSTKELRVGKLHLVDLAGSERLRTSKAEGGTLMETQNINSSLAALGNVLSALSKNATMEANNNNNNGKIQQKVQVPYRDSKLTHLLKDSLGGNSKTLMLTTLRSTAAFYQHTVLSLMYASRAKKIKNRSTVNRDISAEQSSLHQISTDIDGLKQRLQLRALEFDRLTELKYESLEENKILKSKLQLMETANNREKFMLEESLNSVIHNTTGQLAAQQVEFISLQSKLANQLTKYQNKVAEQQKEIFILRSTVEALEKTKVVSGVDEGEVAEMQNILEAWQKQATLAQEEVDKTSERFKVLAETHRRTVEELSRTKKDNERFVRANALDGDVSDLVDVLEKNEIKKKSIELAIVKLNSDMKDLSSMFSQLNIQKSFAEASLENEIFKTVIAKDNELAAAKAAFMKAKEVANSELAAAKSATTKAKEIASTKCKELTATAASLQEELTNTKASHDTKNKAAKKSIKALQTSLTKEMNESDSLKHTILTDKQTIIALRNHVDGSKQKLLDTTTSVSATINELQDQFTKTLGGKDCQLKKIAEEKKTLETSNSAVHQQLQLFESALEVVQGEAEKIVNEKNAEIDRLNKSGTELTKKCRLSATANEALEANLADTTASKNAFEANHAEIMEKYKLSSTSATESQQQCSELLAANEVLNIRLIDTIASQNSFETKLSKALDTAKSNTANFASLKQEKEALESEIENHAEVQNKLNASQVQKALLKTEIDSKDDEIAAMVLEAERMKDVNVQEVDTIVTSKSTEVEKIKTALKKQERVLQTYSKKLSDADGELKTNSRILSAAQTSVSEKSAKIASLEAELTSKVASLQSEISYANDATAKMQEQTVKILEEVSKVREEEKKKRSKLVSDLVVKHDLAIAAARKKDADKLINFVNTASSQSDECVKIAVKEAREELTRALQQHFDESLAAVEQSKVELATQHSSDLADLNAKLVESHDASIETEARITREAKAAQHEMQDAFNAKLANIVSLQQKTDDEFNRVEDLNKKLGVDAQSLQHEFKQSVESSKHHVQRVAELESERDSLASKTSEELVAKSTQCDQRVAEMVVEKDSAVSRIRAELEDLMKQSYAKFEHLTSEKDSTIGKLDKHVGELQQSMRQQLIDVEKATEVLKLKHESGISESSKKFNEVLSQTKFELEAKLVTAQKQLEFFSQQAETDADEANATVELLRNEHTEVMKRLEAEQAATHLDLEASEQEMLALQSNLRTKLTVVKDQLKSEKALSATAAVEAAAELVQTQSSRIALEKDLADQVFNSASAEKKTQELVEEYKQTLERQSQITSSLTLSHSAEVSSLKQKIVSQFQELDVEKAVLKKQHAALLAELNESHAVEIASKEESLRAFNDEQASAHQTTSEKQKSDYHLLSVNFTALQGELSTARELAASNLQELEVRNEDIVVALKSDHSSAMELCIGQSEAVMSALRTKHEAAIITIGEQAEAEIQKSLTQIEVIVATMQSEHEAAIQNLLAEHETTLTVGQSTELVAQESLTLKYTDEITELKNFHQELVDSMVVKHDKKVEEIETDKSRKVAHLKADHSEILTRMKIGHSTEIKEMSDNHDRILHISETKNQSAAVTYESTVSTHLRQLHDLETKYADSSKTHENLVSSLDLLQSKFESIENKLKVKEEKLSEQLEKEGDLQEKLLELEVENGQGKETIANLELLSVTSAEALATMEAKLLKLEFEVSECKNAIKNFQKATSTSDEMRLSVEGKILELEFEVSESKNAIKNYQKSTVASDEVRLAMDGKLLELELEISESKKTIKTFQKSSFTSNEKQSEIEEKLVELELENSENIETIKNYQKSAVTADKARASIEEKLYEQELENVESKETIKNLQLSSLEFNKTQASMEEELLNLSVGNSESEEIIKKVTISLKIAEETLSSSATENQGAIHSLKLLLDSAKEEMAAMDVQNEDNAAATELLCRQLQEQKHVSETASSEAYMRSLEALEKVEGKFLSFTSSTALEKREVIAEKNKHESDMNNLKLSYESKFAALNEQVANSKRTMASLELSLKDKIEQATLQQEREYIESRVQLEKELSVKSEVRVKSEASESLIAGADLARNEICDSILGALCQVDKGGSLASIRNIFIDAATNRMNKQDSDGVVEAITHWAKKNDEAKSVLIAEGIALKERAIKGDVSSKQASQQREIEVANNAAQIEWKRKHAAGRLVSSCRMLWATSKRASIGKAFRLWQSVAVDMKRREVWQAGKDEEIHALRDANEKASDTAVEGYKRNFKKAAALEVWKEKENVRKVEKENEVVVLAEVHSPVSIAGSHFTANGSFGDDENTASSHSKNTQQSLQEQLAIEKAARKALITKAAQKWFAPDDFNSTNALSNLEDETNKAVLEGDSRAVAALCKSAGTASQPGGSFEKLHLLHRCISGFHFHGNQQLLLQTLEVLLNYGFDVNAADSSGNTVLHKTLQVCTSNVVIIVIKYLLKRGIDVSAQNFEGDTPIHVEIRRLRSKSVDVIKLLLDNGADANVKACDGDSQVTLVLRFAQKRSGGGLEDFDSGKGSSSSTTTSAPQQVDDSATNASARRGSFTRTNTSNSNSNSSTYGGRNFWVRVLHLLITSSGKWDSTAKDPLTSHTQLMHLFTGPSPPIGDANAHRDVVRHCLHSGQCNVNAVDNLGQSALFHFCLRESQMPKAACISSLGILEDFLAAGADVSVFDGNGVGSGVFNNGNGNGIRTKGSGFELLQPKIVSALNRNSVSANMLGNGNVSAKKEVRNVVQDLQAGKDLLLSKKRAVLQQTTGTQHHKSDGTVTVRRGSVDMEDAISERGPRTPTMHVTSFDMPPSIFKTPVAGDKTKNNGKKSPVGKGVEAKEREKKGEKEGRKKLAYLSPNTISSMR